MYAMEKLKKDIDSILEEHAEKGIKDCKTLEIVKTALSAKSKILTIEAMERVNEEGFSRGFDRRANGQFREYLHSLMNRADPREKEILEKLLHKL